MTILREDVIVVREAAVRCLVATRDVFRTADECADEDVSVREAALAAFPDAFLALCESLNHYLRLFIQPLKLQMRTVAPRVVKVHGELEYEASAHDAALVLALRAWANALSSVPVTGQAIIDRHLGSPAREVGVDRSLVERYARQMAEAIREIPRTRTDWLSALVQQEAAKVIIGLPDEPEPRGPSQQEGRPPWSPVTCNQNDVIEFFNRGEDPNRLKRKGVIEGMQRSKTILWSERVSHRRWLIWLPTETETEQLAAFVKARSGKVRRTRRGEAVT